MRLPIAQDYFLTLRNFNSQLAKVIFYANPTYNTSYRRNPSS